MADAPNRRRAGALGDDRVGDDVREVGRFGVGVGWGSRSVAVSSPVASSSVPEASCATPSARLCAPVAS